jgi:hypothetical protein
VSSSNAWAVGHYYNTAAAEPLILHWNGSAWKRVASPDPGGSATDTVLYGVLVLDTSFWGSRRGSDFGDFSSLRPRAIAGEAFGIFVSLRAVKDVTMINHFRWK